jgi:hypothetical protein
MRRLFISTLITAFCAAGALAPEALAGRLTITNVAGYSDGPTGIATRPCGFHVVVTYTGKPAKGVGVDPTLIRGTTTSGTVIALRPGPMEPLGPSPFTTSGMQGGNLVTASDYNFIVQLSSKRNKVLAEYQTQDFSLDTSTFQNGCPAPGQIVSS